MDLPKRYCSYCGAECKDFEDLAIHISSSKKGHQRGKKWAASYLLKVRFLNQKRDRPLRLRLTEAEKDNKALATRTLSGIEKSVPTWCPACKTGVRQSIPVEHADSIFAWRTKNKTLIILCPRCQK